MMSLLEQITTNTAQQDSSPIIIRITTAQQLLKLAVRREFKKQSLPQRDTKDLYFDALFRELFAETHFFLRQYKSHCKIDGAGEKTVFFKNRLIAIVDVISEASCELKDRFRGFLATSDEDQANTIHFVLESLDRLESYPPYDRIGILSELCEKEGNHH